MQAALTRDLFPGPLREPDFLEETKPELDRQTVKSRGKKLVLSAALAASTFFLGIPEASASTETPALLVPAEGTYAVPQIAEWKRWLQGLDQGDLDPAVLQRLRSAFTELIEPTGLLPGGMETQAGAYLLVWDFDEHHLELELFPDHWEWFYKNRTTGRLTGGEDLVTTDLSNFRRELAKYVR